METHFPDVAKGADQDAAQALYFDRFSKSYLLSALRSIITSASLATKHTVSGSEAVLPYRLLRSLMDKPEVGDIIIGDILPDLCSCLKIQVESLGGVPTERSSLTKQSVHGLKSSAKEGGGGSKKSGRKSQKMEVLQSANLFFNTLSPEQLWQWMESLLSRTIPGNATVQSPTGERGSEREGEGKREISSCHSIEGTSDGALLESLPSSPGFLNGPEVSGGGDRRGGGGVQLSCASACRLIHLLLQVLPLVCNLHCGCDRIHDCIIMCKVDIMISSQTVRHHLFSSLL